jgi:hypothetical protein
MPFSVAKNSPPLEGWTAQPDGVVAAIAAPQEWWSTWLDGVVAASAALPQDGVVYSTMVVFGA